MRAARLSLLALTCSLLAHTASAGRIADLFSEGLFGLTWGATREQIESAHPGGKWEKTGPVMVYWVTDARPVLNIERGEKSRLGFFLNSDGKLNAVDVEFVPGNLDKWGELLLKSQEAFGPPLVRNPQAAAVGGVSIMEWEIDQGVKVAATYSPGLASIPMSLSVSKVNFDAPKSKEELGFK